MGPGFPWRLTQAALARYSAGQGAAPRLRLEFGGGDSMVWSLGKAVNRCLHDLDRGSRDPSQGLHGNWQQ